MLDDCNNTGISSRTKPGTYELNRESDQQFAPILNNTVLYNAMIHPFTRMVIKGAIWYQGKPWILLMRIIQCDFR
jgi:hypothetical protein